MNVSNSRENIINDTDEQKNIVEQKWQKKAVWLFCC